MNMKVIIATAIAIAAFGTANAREGSGGGRCFGHVCRVAPVPALRCTSHACRMDAESALVPTLAAK